MEKVEPKDEFKGLSKEAVLAALDDPSAENPIAQEVARLIEAYARNFSEHVARLGRIPESILHIKGRWPIEAIAMQLTTESIQETAQAKE